MMGKLEMAINEKGILNEMEKGEYLVLPGRKESVPRRGAGWAIYLKILLCGAFMVFVAHRIRCALRPKIYTRKIAGVPQFVLDYAPLVYLDVGEEFFPSHIAAQISNTHPDLNRSTIDDLPTLTLHNLDILNNYGRHGRNVFLTSDIDVTTSPSWLTGIVPNSSNGKTENAISCAIIISDRGSGLVDAFYMYFYAFNQGNTVLGKELGDHIGDWEHNMIRFEDGIPQAIWYSQHSNGEAFLYSATEKKGSSGKRPVSYAARGSHANYATAGKHDHTIPDLNLPNGLIVDYTSKGTLWDPTLSAYFYNYTAADRAFEGIGGSPVGAMYFRGKWGDEQYPGDDKRQPDPFFGFWKYVDGPTGPRTKQLGRENVCPENGLPCIIRDRLGP